MVKISAKSNVVLGVVALISVLAFLLVEYEKADYQQKWYPEKLEAAKLAKAASECIKSKRLENGVFIDAINDPSQTALIGQEYSLITTDHGSIEAKLSSTNPNFAAVVVQLLKEAGVSEGETVAVSMTGSFPGLNIATLAAIQTLKLRPVIISSVGSSSWGANDPYFTWLDMENVLFEAKIFKYRSIAASIGGSADIGRGLSPEGRSLLAAAIERNKVDFINEEHLEKSIARRIQLYQDAAKNSPVKVYINVGGGMASLGNPVNGKLFPSGLSTTLPKANFPVEGVMIKMGQQGIPIIHLLNINTLLEKYGLPSNPGAKQKPGVGEIFVKKKYNLPVTALATIVLIIAILVVYLSDRKNQQLGIDIADRETTTDDLL
jgi:poly-gamma-glutamate system protein